MTAKQVKALQKRLLQLEEENLILKKAIAFLHASLQQRLEAVHRFRFQHKIKTFCSVLNVNRSTYYKHFSSPESVRAKQDKLIKPLLLQREYGLKIGQTRVRRLFKSMNLSKIFSRKVPTQFAKSESGDFKNHLNRKFNPDAPNKAWASDITYLKVASKWHYLCVVIDLFSRKVINTFRKAYRSRNCPQWLMFHSDRGSQYTSSAFRQRCPFDNAVIEAFFKFLKAEETNRKSYSTLTGLRISLFEYIDGFYNAKRPHSAIHFLSPNDFEAKFFSYA